MSLTWRSLIYSYDSLQKELLFPACMFLLELCVSLVSAAPRQPDHSCALLSKMILLSKGPSRAVEAWSFYLTVDSYLAWVSVHSSLAPRQDGMHSPGTCSPGVRWEAEKNTICLRFLCSLVSYPRNLRQIQCHFALFFLLRVL